MKTYVVTYVVLGETDPYTYIVEAYTKFNALDKAKILLGADFGVEYTITNIEEADCLDIAELLTDGVI